MKASGITGKVQNLDKNISNCEKDLLKLLKTQVNRNPKTIQQLASQYQAKNITVSKQSLFPFAARVQGVRSTYIRSDELNVNSPPSTSFQRDILPTEETENLVIDHSMKKNVKIDNSSQRSSSTCLLSRPSKTKVNEVLPKNQTAVEAIVNKRKRSRSSICTSKGERTTWGCILSQSQPSAEFTQDVKMTIDNGSTFSQFDPLRTLHFLTRELQSKLHGILPAETPLHQIVVEIKQSLNRLPPQSTTNLLRLNSTTAITSEVSSQTRETPVVHRASQTDFHGDTSEMQHKLQTSCTKLEANCKVLEGALVETKQERDEFKEALCSEKQALKKLKTEIEDLKCRLQQSIDCPIQQANTTNIIHDLEKQCQKLSAERDSFKKRLEEKNIATQGDLTVQVTLHQQQINQLEKEKSEACNKVIVMRLEHEKLNVLLQAREKQVQELKNELTGIQHLVANQLSDLQKSSRMNRGLVSSSPATSVTSLGASPSWQMLSHITGERDFFEATMVSGLSSEKNIATVKENKVEKKHRSKVPRHKSRSPVAQTVSHHYRSKENDTNPTIKQNANITPPGDFKIPGRDGGPQGDRTTVKEIFQDFREQVLLNVDVTLPSPPKMLPIPDNVSSCQSQNSQWSDSHSSNKT